VRDWNRLVNERLAALDLSDGSKREVVAEIAAHLEDCDANRLPNIDKVDWPDLVAQIQRAKSANSPLNERTRQLWLPSIASLLAANLLLMVLSLASQAPRSVSMHGAALFPGLATVGDYLPWLAAQPLVGALGAWLSRRAGGGPLTRLAAALFPSFVMLGCWGLFIPLSSILQKEAWTLQHPVYLAAGAFMWVIPGMMGLALGSFPFVVNNRRNLQPTHD
jgi:hypothetical protein